MLHVGEVEERLTEQAGGNLKQLSETVQERERKDGHRDAVVLF